jgi:hypothetical protein
MAVNPADMENCNIKNTCLGGVNDGVAYDPESPCGGAANVAFNPVSCDCEETVFCANGDCGWDVDWEITSTNQIWSMKPCGASSCTIICESDEYRVCASYTPTSGSFYLAPGKCVREVRQETNGPCDGIGESAPGGAFIREDWYLCNDGVENPSGATCGTPVAQMPGGGYCSTVMTGPGIQEVNRIERVKLTTVSTATGIYRTTASASCGNCDPTVTSSGPFSNYISWRAPIVRGSEVEVRFSSTSPFCPEGSPCPGTWQSEIGADWVQIGSSIFYDGSTTDIICGVSDGLAVMGTAGITWGGIQKGDKIAYVISYGWTGAVGCTQEGTSSLDNVVESAYACYKPSDLV